MSLRRPNGFISAGYDPLEVPNAPTIGTATSAGPTAVSVTFTAPSNVGGSAIIEFVANAKKTSDGTTISGTGSSSPVTISGLTTGDAYTVTVAAVNSFGLGVSSAASNSVTPLEQQLWSWGFNEGGQLGINDTANKSSPVQVGAQADWYEVTCGRYNTVAIKQNGTLWSWGRGDQGRSGQNNTISRSSPVQVGALTNWYQASVSNHCISIKTDGTLWGWGNNPHGQLGINNTINRSSPVQIGALTNWAQASTGGQGLGFSMAVKTDGTLWAWGGNTSGALGLGDDTVNRSSPVQVGALTGWAQVACGGYQAIAVKTNGTLWAWGANPQGQLGQNDTVYRSSPTQIGALTNWLQASAGVGRFAAVKTDGTLWVLGNGGLSTLVSSPVQVGALSTWYEVSAMNGFLHALKTDGTLWSWGGNFRGALGQGDTINRSSPTQVGLLATWQHLGQGCLSENILAIKG
jgi:alpha-tubulin suppressor-like RCC1 family protein